MSLVRRNSANDLMTFPSGILSVQREINNLFDTFFRGSVEDSGLITTAWNPAVDITEHDNAFTVKVELPGVSRDNVRITIQDNILTIRGEKKQEKETKGTNVHRTERSYGVFQRSFSLPYSVSADAIEAKYADGVLTINLPKAEEAKRKEIEVKVR